MRFGRTAPDWPPGQAWATYGPLTTLISDPPNMFHGYRGSLPSLRSKPMRKRWRINNGMGLYPDGMSDASMALTAPTDGASEAADWISWSVLAGLLGVTGYVFVVAAVGKK